MSVDRELMSLLRDWRTYGAALKSLLNAQPDGPRYWSPIGFSLGVTTSAPPARNGNVVTGCTVKLTRLVAAKPQTNPPTWTITDQGKPDVWAVQLSGTAGVASREVILVRILGIWIIVAYDCTTGSAPSPAPAAATQTQTNQNVTTQNGQQVATQ